MKASFREPAHSAARPEPETALGVFTNGKNARTRKPVSDGIGGELPVAITRQAVPGSHPEVAPAVLINIQYSVAGQPVLVLVAGEFAVRETAHARVEGADPELPRPVFMKRPNVV